MDGKPHRFKGKKNSLRTAIIRYSAEFPSIEIKQLSARTVSCARSTEVLRYLENAKNCQEVNLKEKKTKHNNNKRCIGTQDISSEICLQRAVIQFV